MANDVTFTIPQRSLIKTPNERNRKIVYAVQQPEKPKWCLSFSEDAMQTLLSPIHNLL